MKQHSKSNSKNTTSKEQAKEFPGYPPYPAQDDITRNDKRVEGNLDDEFEQRNPKNASLPDKPANSNTDAPEAETEVEPGEFDVTGEDLEALGPVDLSLDLGEDEQLKQRTNPVDFAGEDLDIPGTSEDDPQEDIGSEDEENNSYSLGGDGHSDLEEGRQ
jgi:hypothetical protein